MCVVSVVLGPTHRAVGRTAVVQLYILRCAANCMDRTVKIYIHYVANKNTTQDTDGYKKMLLSSTVQDVIQREIKKLPPGTYALQNEVSPAQCVPSMAPPDSSDGASGCATSRRA